MKSLDACFGGSLQIGQVIIEEQSDGRIELMPSQHMVKDLPVRLSHFQNMRIVGMFKERLEAGFSRGRLNNFAEELKVNIVGVAQQKNPVPPAKAFKKADPFDGDCAQHGVPCGIDIRIRQVALQCAAQLAPELLVGNESFFILVKKRRRVHELADFTYRAAAGSGEGLVCPVEMEIEDHTAKVKDQVLDGVVDHVKE